MGEIEASRRGRPGRTDPGQDARDARGQQCTDRHCAMSTHVIRRAPTTRRHSERGFSCHGCDAQIRVSLFPVDEISAHVDSLGPAFLVKPNRLDGGGAGDRGHGLEEAEPL